MALAREVDDFIKRQNQLFGADIIRSDNVEAKLAELGLNPEEITLDDLVANAEKIRGDLADVRDAVPRQIEDRPGIVRRTVEKIVPAAQAAVQPTLRKETAITQADLSENQKNVARTALRVAQASPLNEKIDGFDELFVGLVGQESSFGEQLRSSADAVGPFQFIKATATDQGLIVDEENDERLDIEKSAKAAENYLSQLFDQFGNPEKAFKAYNVGPGNLRKIIAGTKEEPKETREYFTRIQERARRLFSGDVSAERQDAVQTTIDGESAAVGQQAASDGVFSTESLLREISGEIQQMERDGLLDGLSSDSDLFKDIISGFSQDKGKDQSSARKSALSKRIDNYLKAKNVNTADDFKQQVERDGVFTFSAKQAAAGIAGGVQTLGELVSNIQEGEKNDARIASGLLERYKEPGFRKLVNDSKLPDVYFFALRGIDNQNITDQEREDRVNSLRERLGDVIGAENNIASNIGESISAIGREALSGIQQSIAEGGYQPKFQGSLAEQEGLSNKLGYLVERSLESSIPSGIAVAGALASRGLRAAGSQVLSRTAIGGTAGTVAALEIGDIRSELEDQGLYDPDDAESTVGLGLVISAIDVATGGNVASVGRDIIKFLSKDTIKEIGAAAAKEAGTEVLQEALNVGNAITQGGAYTPSELIERAAVASFTGGVLGGGSNTISSAFSAQARGAQTPPDGVQTEQEVPVDIPSESEPTIESEMEVLKSKLPEDVRKAVDSADPETNYRSVRQEVIDSINSELNNIESKDDLSDADRLRIAELNAQSAALLNDDIASTSLTEEQKSRLSDASDVNRFRDLIDSAIEEASDETASVLREIKRSFSSKPEDNDAINNGIDGEIENANNPEQARVDSAIVKISNNKTDVISSSERLPVKLRKDVYRARSIQPNSDSISNFSINDETLFDLFTRKFLRRMRRFENVQKAISEQGGIVDDLSDVVSKSKLLPGRVELDIRKMQEEYIQPYIDFVVKNDISDTSVSKGIKDILGIDVTKTRVLDFENLKQFGMEINASKSQEVSNILDVYLIAKHAIERNNYIASINKRFPDGGSGMKTSDAIELIKLIQNSKFGEQYVALARNMWGLADSRRKFLASSGLVDSDVVDGWQSNYSFYVPLKGFYDKSLDTDPVGARASGLSLSKESFNARGRSTLPNSPIRQIIQDTTQTIINSKKLEVANGLFDLAASNPDPNLWEIFSDDKPDFTTRQNSRTGVIEDVKENMNDTRKYVRANINGKNYYIKLNDNLLLSAFNNLGSEQLGSFTRNISVLTRLYSRINTSLSPVFVLTNFLRDVPTGLFNTMSFTDLNASEKRRLVSSMITELPNSMASIWRTERGNPGSSVYDRYYQEFKEDGAKTGFFDSKSIDEIRKQLESFAKDARTGVIGDTRRTVKSIGEFVDAANTSVENAIRLSAYANLREQGQTRQQAAIKAKELTVDFNQKGELGSRLNAWYAFFNASAQGTERFARTLATSKTAQASALAISTLGYIMGMIGRASSEEDNDGVLFYDKAPEYLKRRNILIMKENGKDFWAIPLPYGINFLYNAGNLLEGFINSKSERHTAANSGKNLVATFLESFLPFSIGDSESALNVAAKTIMPTAFRPVVDIALNEDAFGNQIIREDFPGAERPAATKFSRSTPATLKAVTKWLNEATGGSEYVSGWADFSPRQIEHVFRFATGGLGRFVEESSQTLGRTLIEGEKIKDIPDNRIPFWDIVSRETRPYADIEQYYQRTTKLKQFVREAKNLRNADKRTHKLSYGEIFILDKLRKKTDKTLRNIRERRDQIIDSSLKEPEKRKLLENILNRQDATVDRFNKSWNKAYGLTNTSS